MKFNFINRKQPQATVNHEGAKAYVMTPELELYAAVATTMLSDVHYETADARLNRIRQLAQEVDPAFVARLAVYARTEMNLRSAPVVLATELAKQASGKGLVSRTLNRVVQRPDEITEVLAYYQIANARTGAKKLNRISKQVQKGLAASFNRFDEYQFAKYDRDGAVKLRDALFLVHPKAKDEAQQAIFDKIANRELSTPYTWETALSALGPQGFESDAKRNAAVRAKWEELIDSGKLGYMATLRNLRNMLEAGVDMCHFEKVCSFLGDADAVRRSRQLPFRFLAAYRELKDLKGAAVRNLLEALETALARSVANMKGFGAETRVVVACDVSGSMQQPVSPKSKVLLYDVGLMLGMLLQSKCRNVIAGMFGDSWKQVTLTSSNVLANVDAFYRREGEVGYATNGYLVLRDLIARKYIADKIMLFTDAQLWDSRTGNASKQNTLQFQWEIYKRIAPTARLYVFDLAGHGTTPLRMEGNDVALIAGWSDKVFEVLDAMENGADALSVIEAIDLQ